jgi:DNA polymerase-3 subunit delta'
MDIPWLKSVTQAYESSQAQGRPPHALMITGAAGTGKRSAAAWLARQRLGMEPVEALPRYPLAIPEHADLRWITTPEDKHTIGIEQIRTLVGELNLTSYAGGGKVAVIEPADVMTTNAANSLLKTLEEPPGDTLLILVADRLGRLPATIYSRCQRLSIRLPSENVGLEWLQRIQPGVTNWPKVLKNAGYAPLAALRGQERIDDTDAMASDFVAVAAGSAAPLQVAAKWAKYEPEFVLGWLSRQVQSCVIRVTGGESAGVSAVLGDSVLGRIDRRNLFCYLDIINRLRGQPIGSFNVQLTLECLLIDWSQGLQTVLGTE